MKEKSAKEGNGFEFHEWFGSSTSRFDQYKANMFDSACFLQQERFSLHGDIGVLVGIL